jgi:hypothetical protein
MLPREISDPRMIARTLVVIGEDAGDAAFVDALPAWDASASARGRV